MLMSTMPAPMPATIRAVSAMAAASRPAICTLTGTPPSTSALARTAARVDGRGVTISVEATISLTTSPTPPALCRATARRNGRSVIPAIGARNTGGSRVWSPIWNGSRMGHPVNRAAAVCTGGGRVICGYPARCRASRQRACHLPKKRAESKHCDLP